MEEQLEILRKLSQAVYDTYTLLISLEDNYFDLFDQHRAAKETLAFAIDDAYENGNVIGKNEREREAYLRKLLPTEHNEVMRLESMMRGVEREVNRERRVAERLTLQVEIAKMVANVRPQISQIIGVPVDKGHPEYPFHYFDLGSN